MWLWLSRLPLVLRVIALLASVLSFLLIAFLVFLLCVDLIGGVVIFFPALHTKEVNVEIGDGWVRVEPAAISLTISPVDKKRNAVFNTEVFEDFVFSGTVLPDNTDYFHYLL